MAEVKEDMVKKFWSKLFFFFLSFKKKKKKESLIPMCFTRNGDIIMVVNQKKLVIFNLYEITQSWLKKENIQSSWKCQA